ncbi:DNA-binding protein HU-beta [Paenibacillus sp. LBL]|uniref:HU family DNA-binding protein n=1 Tax=Paenibacillus sp. LBL TaxID=2940563 RepID=UPI0024735C4F|nr:HU family DNA-binding protein [Paenibacillus sp. LBL]MDH6674417.1 DNA-binding protein HU-beta [Paenibacillus sp. LBL]
MNKADLVNEIAQRYEMTKKDATEAVNVVFDTIYDALVNGEDVKVNGFGTFEIRKRAARNGRNPQTGEEMLIPASNTVGLKPAKALKEDIN